MTLLDSRRIDDVLSDLVAHDVLSADQAHAVTEALASPEPERVAPAAPVAPPGPGPEPAPAGAGLRARLVEAAAYLGALLVAAGVLAAVAQNWDSMSSATQVAVLAVSGALAYLGGLGAALLPGGGPLTIRLHGQARRRRLAGTLMTVGAVVGPLALPVALDASLRSFLAAAVVALVVLVPAQLLAPSAMTELGLFGAAVLVVQLGLALVVPERPESDYTDALVADGRLPMRAWDFLIPGALAALGLLWASLVSRVLTLPVVAQVVGLGLAFVASASLAAEESTRTGGLVALAVLAVVGVVVFVREHGWPWLAVAVLATTVAVFVLVAQTADPAVALLVSGLVLLLTAGGGAALGRRRRAAA